MRYMDRKYTQSGLTLIELMVAMVLGLFLMGGVIQMHAANRQTSRVSEGVSRIQENARYAMAMIQREVRMAGYFGCNSETDIKDTLNANTLFIADFKTPIEGLEATGATSWLPVIGSAQLSQGTADTNQAVGGSDVLTVRRVGDMPLAVVEEMPNVSAALKITAGLAPPPLANDDIVIITDCTKSALLQITNYTQASGNVVHNTGAGPTPGNSTKILSDSSPFSIDAELLKMQTTAFFIGNDTNGEPALHRRINAKDSEVLVGGVENMQILYGVDTDSDNIADRYLDAENINAVNTASPTIPDWTNVTSVRVALLLQSPNNATDQTDNDSYDLLGEVIDTSGPGYNHEADRKLRYVVSSTIQLRNGGL